MKIAFATTFDAQNVKKWSGTPYFMSRALNAHGHDIQYAGSLKRNLAPFFTFKKVVNGFLNQRESPRFNIHAATHYSQQLAAKLSQLPHDIIVSPLINPIAYLQSKKPIVLWTDAVYASLLGFYPPFAFHSANTIREGNAMTFSCLSRASLVLFSSDWAARAAIEFYGISEDKVKVVPFGANIDTPPDFTEIKNAIAKRPADKIKLLFLAKSWERKGGDIVLAVTHALHQAGYPVELSIVGIEPPGLSNPPPYIRCLGYISKQSNEGKAKLATLLAKSHFLFVPSRGEAYGIVFCEANAYGVPCLTTHVGGIGTVVKPNINGMTFGLDAPLERYCNYITSLHEDKTRYQELALSSYNEFTTRLNWTASVNTATRLMLDL